LVGWFVVVVSVTSAVERLPIEDFARQPDTSRAQLSPDGESLAFLRDYGQRTMLHVDELDTGRHVRLEVGGARLVNNVPKEVESFTWIGDRRLLVTTAVWDLLYGVLAVDRDGDHAVPIGDMRTTKSIISGPYSSRAACFIVSATRINPCSCSTGTRTPWAAGIGRTY
jgi:dipeptidyl aminopeptidase/acylaminoacyl peptidase